MLDDLCEVAKREKTMVTWARGSKRLMAHGKPEAGTVI